MVVLSAKLNLHSVTRHTMKTTPSNLTIKNAITAICFAIILLLSQHYLYLHELNHDVSHEQTEHCDLCSISHQGHNGLLKTATSLVIPATFSILLSLLLSPFILVSPRYLLAHARAPPQ
jgi:hypothetical protein